MRQWASQSPWGSSQLVSRENYKRTQTWTNCPIFQVRYTGLRDLECVLKHFPLVCNEGEHEKVPPNFRDFIPLSHLGLARGQGIGLMKSQYCCNLSKKYICFHAWANALSPEIHFWVLYNISVKVQKKRLLLDSDTKSRSSKARLILPVPEISSKPLPSSSHRLKAFQRPFGADQTVIGQYAVLVHIQTYPKFPKKTFL